MADVINLNRTRKTKAREGAKARAVENRVAFGRTKAEREAQAARSEKARQELDGHRRKD